MRATNPGPSVVTTAGREAPGAAGAAVVVVEEAEVKEMGVLQVGQLRV